MIAIEKSIGIEKEAEVIWNSLTQFTVYRSWNPVVNHAAIYGPIAAGTGIKVLMGSWDFGFIITKARAPREFEMKGSSVGIKIKLSFYINNGVDSSVVNITAEAGGWLSGIFKRRVRVGLEDTLEIFLNALKKRALSDGSYEIDREDSKHEKPESDNITMPTPFNLIYKTRTRKFRKGGSRFR